MFCCPWMQLGSASSWRDWSKGWSELSGRQWCSLLIRHRYEASSYILSPDFVRACKRFGRACPVSYVERLDSNSQSWVENTNMTDCISLQSIKSNKHLPQSPFIYLDDDIFCVFLVYLWFVKLQVQLRVLYDMTWDKLYPEYCGLVVNFEA